MSESPPSSPAPPAKLIKVRRRAGNVTEVMCPICDKMLSSLQNVRKHMRNVHKLETDDIDERLEGQVSTAKKCPHCLKYNTNITRHMKICKKKQKSITVNEVDDIDMADFLECNLAEGTELLCSEDPDSDAEVGFGSRLMLGSTDDTLEEISSPSPVNESASHERDLDSGNVVENSFPPLVEPSVELFVADETASTSIALHPSSVSDVEEETDQSSLPIAEINMELDQEQDDVGDENEENEDGQDMREQLPSLEEQIHSMILKENVPLTVAGIRYLCFGKEDVDGKFLKLWREFLGRGDEKRALNKLRKYNSSSIEKIPELQAVPWEGISEQPNLEHTLGLPNYFVNYPSKVNKADVNVMLCKNEGFKTSFLEWCGNQEEGNQNESRLFRLFSNMMNRKKLPLALANSLYEFWPKDKLINAQNLENVCSENKRFEQVYHLFKANYGGNLETLRSSIRKR
jgi:hypothetical protein